MLNLICEKTKLKSQLARSNIKSKILCMDGPNTYQTSNSSFSDSLSNRVATTQGKQGIWLLTFPDRKNREFSEKNFLHRENCANTGKILKI